MHIGVALIIQQQFKTSPKEYLNARNSSNIHIIDLPLSSYCRSLIIVFCHQRKVFQKDLLDTVNLHDWICSCKSRREDFQVCTNFYIVVDRMIQIFVICGGRDSTSNIRFSQANVPLRSPIIDERTCKETISISLFFVERLVAVERGRKITLVRTLFYIEIAVNILCLTFVARVARGKGSA